MAHRLYLIDPATGQPGRVDDEVSDAPASLAWSPDGRYLAYLTTVDLGPAPAGAGELRAYDTATGRTTRLDQGRHVVFSPVWTPEGSAVVYRVGSWQHSNGPVASDRAPLDGRGGAPWAWGVHAVVPGPGGRWLGVREPWGGDGPAEVLVVAADGAAMPTGRDRTSLPAAPVARKRGSAMPVNPYSTNRSRYWT